ncbi:exosortase F-associated protein [Dokdonia sp. Hel_I_53]|nr:exosortase F-associated protein [Dokdonia sp. Hel_I_53]
MRVLITTGCLIGLLCIRFRESELFYDPLINYFQGAYQNHPLPIIVEWKLLLYLLLRFFLNTALSMGLLWAVFYKKEILKLAVLLYVVVGVLLMVAMCVMLQFYKPENYLPLFYVRRFLIQPLLVFLLIPAFFYARKVN